MIGQNFLVRTLFSRNLLIIGCIVRFYKEQCSLIISPDTQQVNANACDNIIKDFVIMYQEHYLLSCSWSATTVFQFTRRITNN